MEGFFSKLLVPWLFGLRVDCVVKSRMDVHVIVLVVSLLFCILAAVILFLTVALSVLLSY